MPDKAPFELIPEKYKAKPERIAEIRAKEIHASILEAKRKQQRELFVQRRQKARKYLEELIGVSRKAYKKAEPILRKILVEKAPKRRKKKGKRVDWWERERRELEEGLGF